MKTRSLVIAAFAILSGFMMALGFNTLDWMTQVPNQPAIWYFIYHSPILSMPFWYAYFFGGIMPLWGGGFLAGIIVGLVLRKRKAI
jgi:hypothetical protein